MACKQTKQHEEKFDKIKWATQVDKDYPYRDDMLKDLITNGKLHGMNVANLLNLLGKPTRTDSGYLFYMVSQQRLGLFPLHTKSLVIKLSKDTVLWVKTHE